MTKEIVLSNTNELLRMLPERIIYITSDGNYSTFVFQDKSEWVFTMSLNSCLKVLQHHLGDGAQVFIRIGKRLIVNRSYIYRINVQRQLLIMSDMRVNQAFTLHASKDALRQLKGVLEK